MGWKFKKIPIDYRRFVSALSLPVYYKYSSLQECKYHKLLSSVKTFIIM